MKQAKCENLNNKELLLMVNRARARTISSLNTLYISISVAICTLLYLYQWLANDSEKIQLGMFPVVIISYLLFSRSHEIFCAFLHDAFDRLKKKKRKSSLSNAKRLELSLKSYLELILNFAIFYYVIPVAAWKECNGVENIIEAIYFSGVTITTLGYGDISPIHQAVQLATIYEVFCGFVLLIVAFAMYTKENHES